MVMKTDLVSENNRGPAMGLNEFAVYLSVSLMACLSGYIAHKNGVSPYPFYVGIIISLVSQALTAILIQDTKIHVYKDSSNNTTKPLDSVFIFIKLKNKTLCSETKTGLVNNLIDGMIWGLLPMVVS